MYRLRDELRDLRGVVLEVAVQEKNVGIRVAQNISQPCTKGTSFAAIAFVLEDDRACCQSPLSRSVGRAVVHDNNSGRVGGGSPHDVADMSLFVVSSDQRTDCDHRSP